MSSPSVTNNETAKTITAWLKKRGVVSDKVIGIEINAKVNQLCTVTVVIALSEDDMKGMFTDED